MKKLALALFAVAMLSGCESDTDCRQMRSNETCNGGDSTWWTCDNSSSCYQTREACQASDDCS